MPRLAADPVIVLPEQREALEQLVRTHSTPQQLALRARIILHADEGVGVRESARELGVWPKTVRYWRKRWRRMSDGRSVSERLADAPRSGAPPTFTPEQICAVVAMTCEKPSEACPLRPAVRSPQALHPRPQPQWALLSKPGSPTCSRGSMITTSTVSIGCCPGIGSPSLPDWRHDESDQTACRI